MMSYQFRYKAGDTPVSAKYTSFVEELTTSLASSSVVTNESDYNALLKQIDAVIVKNAGAFSDPTPVFDREMADIAHNPSEAFPDPMIVPVVWGGVVHKFIDVEGQYEKEKTKHVQKLLVIQKRGILGFEIHKEKYEHLDVVDGVCLFIHSIHTSKDWKEGQVFLTLAEKGASTTLLPGDEHGMIALSNTVVKETSSYHLKDLIFLFNSEQVI